MDITCWDPGDHGTAAALHEVWKAAHEADGPATPPKSLAAFRSLLSGDWDGEQFEAWYAVDGGTPAGYCRIGLPDLENLDRAHVQLFVHPRARRGGLGTALLRHAARRAAANGRAILSGIAGEGSPGEAFAARTGATLTLREARRVQDLTQIPARLIADLRARAERHAAGYELVTWTGPVPAERAAGMAGVFNAFADAPRGAGTEPEVWDAGRVLRRTGKLLRETALRGYSVAALRAPTGEMAAFTEVLVDPDHPAWGYQELTAVTRPHRGHRLGLLVKAAMLQWLATAEPRLERIETGNAVENDHMIAINDALGYKLAPPSWLFYEIGVAKVS
jgi:GNAT superfamily N-acetyltransferase